MLEIEETNDPMYLYLAKRIMGMQSEFEKLLEEKIVSLHESSSLRSTSSTPIHQLSSSSRSKYPLREKVSNNSFEHTSIFHDRPIFDQDENDKNGPRHTFERAFTPLGFSYDMVLETSVANKIITLAYKSRPYEPEVKLPWWRNDHYCGYHKNKGHKIEDCIMLKCKIQDLIDDRIIDVEIPKDLYDEETSLEQDHVDEPMSSDGFLNTSNLF